MVRDGQSEDADATQAASPPTDDDPRLLAAVQEYMHNLEAGRRPNRQEFISRHPEIARDLSACLDGLAFVHSAARQMGDDSPAGHAAANSPDEVGLGEPLGDYRLVREIGRGGMGVVYEAVQLSLGRRVAVKVLPLAAALDTRQLQRFRNEAQAAAQLHHTNIVPVYAVGCERAVHYYAMQLIEGQSLAEVIAQLRKLAGRMDEERDASQEALAATVTWRDQPANPEPQPGRGFFAEPSSAPLSPPVNNLSTLRSSKPAHFFRDVARMGLQAAEALEYAHGLGVVHRDIKPANLLLDIRGNLWITDFGLAQMYAQSNLTHTGDLVGTLRYMSPEQASGRAVVLDQRTDIYSLGVTLYELLTLERALPGKTREQLLHEIGAHEPRPARTINRAIPPELETILIKATAKEATDRYASARALADDLRRFLNDEPILARPPSLWDKAVKWTRRHKSVAVSVLVMLVLAVAGLLTSTLLIAREQSRTKDEQARTASAYELERKQRNRAERSFTQAREAVDFFTRVAAQEMADPRFNDVRKEMLQTALVYYQNFLQDRRDDSTLEAELTAAQSRISTIIDELAAFDEFGRAMFRSWLVQMPSVHDDLKLTPEQREKVRGGPGGRLPQVAFDMRAMRTMSPSQKRQQFAELTQQQESRLADLLDPQQYRRLRQIVRQVRGPAAFTDPDVVSDLVLTRTQIESIRQILETFHDDKFGRMGPKGMFDRRDGPRPPGGADGTRRDGPPPDPNTDKSPDAPDRPAASRGDRTGGPRPDKGPADMSDAGRKRAMEQIMAILTPSQAAEWKDLAGPEFTGEIEGPFGGPPRMRPGR